jgi:hypothetical protein
MDVHKMVQVEDRPSRFKSREKRREIQQVFSISRTLHEGRMNFKRTQNVLRNEVMIKSPGHPTAFGMGKEIQLLGSLKE